MSDRVGMVEEESKKHQETKYPRILAPMEIGSSIRVPNRLYFAPMGIDLASTSGEFTSELNEFYRGIVDGGCGFLFLGNASIDKNSRLQERGLCLYNQRQADSFSDILEYGKSKNCTVGIQLQHYGAQGSSEFTGQAMLSPSGVACRRMQQADNKYALKIMSTKDIQYVIDSFASAAKKAYNAGAELIQIQASNGYLISSFLSPYTNLRDDAYGGDEKRRARLLLEIVDAIHRETNGNLTVSVRLGIDDRLGDKGQRPELLEYTVSALEEAGVAAITASICIGETFNDFVTYSKDTHRALINGVTTVKSFTRLPVGFAGFVDSVPAAEKILENEISDFVGMSRSIFADNDLIVKTLRDEEHKIHRCLFDGNCFKDKGNPNFDRVYCCVNPKYLRPATNVVL